MTFDYDADWKRDTAKLLDGLYGWDHKMTNFAKELIAENEQLRPESDPMLTYAHVTGSSPSKDPGNFKNRRVTYDEKCLNLLMYILPYLSAFILLLMVGFCGICNRLC